LGLVVAVHGGLREDRPARTDQLERVRGELAALQEAGVQPFASPCWPIAGVPVCCSLALAAPIWSWPSNRDKDAEAVRCPRVPRVAEAMDAIRQVTPAEVQVPSFADVGNQLLAGEAAGNIHGDWLQGDLQVAGGVPGENYECLPRSAWRPALGRRRRVLLPGPARRYDEAVVEAQGQLARILIGQDAQLAFNMKKGSMPIRTDIDLAQANPCMQKALGLLENGLLPSGDWALSSDTQQQLQDLNIEFLADLSITVDDYVERYASIIESAD
jgi:glucose/mannose transport system substrate-binding protein